MSLLPGVFVSAAQSPPSSVGVNLSGTITSSTLNFSWTTPYTVYYYSNTSNSTVGGVLLGSNTTSNQAITVSHSPVMSNWYWSVVFASNAYGSSLGISSPVVQLVGVFTTSTFSYTGADQSFNVPPGVTSMTCYMWGAGGGYGLNAGQIAGGAGCYLQGNFTVSPSSTLTIIVGRGGFAYGTATGNAYGGGGLAGNSSYGGGGGGRSAIQVSGVDIVTAGGGGGSGLTYSMLGGHANYSPTINGGNGFNCSSTYPGVDHHGKGGTQTQGGAGGVGDRGGANWSDGGSGSLNLGGNASVYGGGGGGGFYGGGGGGWTQSIIVGGGGGGSSLSSNLTGIVGYNSSNGYHAPNITSPYYSGTVATGGINSAGGNGKVVLTYYV